MRKLDKAQKELLRKLPTANELGKNHKKLRGTYKGKEVFQLSGSFGSRLVYYIESGKRTVLKIFKKGEEKPL